MTNYVPLSPVSFLERAGDIFPTKVAVRRCDRSVVSYAEMRQRARQQAAALRRLALDNGDRVAVLSRNSVELLQMHFAVPGAGAVLVALNTRLSLREYEFILRDCAARVLFVESSLHHLVAAAAKRLGCEVVVLPSARSDDSRPVAGHSYAEWLDRASAQSPPLALPDDEHDAISINYTSGTTGQPKGAVYSHRGAYLNALGVALEFHLTPSSVYLWTLPMFHCNGWCFTWAVTAVGATHVALADFDPEVVLDLMGEHGVSHLCGAPVVLDAIATAGAGSRHSFTHGIRIATGGAPPSPATIGRMQDLGLDVIHLYGLTETYGPSLICEVQPEWAELDAASYAEKLSRQGVRTINVESVRVVDEEGRDVPPDGESLGEIIIRSNTVVPGYHERPGESDAAIVNGWLHSGDLAVVHEDGYVEIRDRRKDIIISGGENVSSVEVENVLMAHPTVLEAAVVAVPHERWGEVPVAFVSVRPGAETDEQTLIEFVRDRLAHFKAPKAIKFETLPKTSTGKIQKYELRERARRLRSAGELQWNR